MKLCAVCGCELVRRAVPDPARESAAQFAARDTCSRAHGATWSAGRRAVAISEAAQRRGLNARPDLVAESWA
jgi:hypothetical protein